jgi:hypothetical protein
MYRTAMTLEIHIALLIALAVVVCLAGLLIGRATVRRGHPDGTGHVDPATASAAVEETAAGGDGDEV